MHNIFRVKFPMNFPKAKVQTLPNVEWNSHKSNLHNKKIHLRLHKQERIYFILRLLLIEILNI